MLKGVEMCQKGWGRRGEGDLQKRNHLDSHRRRGITPTPPPS
jgi:hypothetical protein